MVNFSHRGESFWIRYFSLVDSCAVCSSDKAREIVAATNLPDVFDLFIFVKDLQIFVEATTHSEHVLKIPTSCL